MRLFYFAGFLYIAYQSACNDAIGHYTIQSDEHIHPAPLVKSVLQGLIKPDRDNLVDQPDLSVYYNIYTHMTKPRHHIRFRQLDAIRL